MPNTYSYNKQITNTHTAINGWFLGIPTPNTQLILVKIFVVFNTIHTLLSMEARRFLFSFLYKNKIFFNYLLQKNRKSILFNNLIKHKSLWLYQI